MTWPVYAIQDSTRGQSTLQRSIQLLMIVYIYEPAVDTFVKVLDMPADMPLQIRTAIQALQAIETGELTLHALPCPALPFYSSVLACPALPCPALPLPCHALHFYGSVLACPPNALVCPSTALSCPVLLLHCPALFTVLPAFFPAHVPLPALLCTFGSCCFSRTGTVPQIWPAKPCPAFVLPCLALSLPA